jgi:hypothetical protein
MSYLEIIWWVLLVVIPITMLILTEDGGAFFCGLFFMIVIGGVSNIISSVNNEYKITHQHELTINYISLNDSSLNIIDDEYRHYIISDYKTIQKYKNGRKFYKTYYYKKCFGLDEEIMELVVK